MEIKPKNNTKSLVLNNKTQIQNHTIRLEYNWEQSYVGTKPRFGFRFRVGTPFCNDNREPEYNFAGGTLTYEINNPLGTNYDFTLEYVCWSTWTNSYQDCGWLGDYFDVYVDGNLYTRMRGHGFIEPWFGYLGVDISGSEIGYSYSGRNVNYFTSKDCAPIIGKLYEDLPTIKIIQGEEYLSFMIESTEDTIGDSFYSGDYLNEFPVLINDKPNFKSEVKYGIVSAEVNGKVAKDTIKILKVNEDDFEMEVKTEPSEINTGEETNITMKQKQSDGTRTEFAATQLFNVSIIDGADYGTLISTNGIDTSDSFTQIEQGFKFKAAENINLDSVEIIIKVTTEVEIGDPVITKVNNTIDKKNKTINSTTGIFFPPGSTKTIEGVGRVIIKKGGCGEGAPVCNGEPEAPLISSIKGEADYSVCDLNKIKRGSFLPNWKWPYSSITIEGCFNKGSNNWQFHIRNNVVNLEYKLMICYENLNRMYSHLITSYNDLETIQEIDFCKAIKDFRSQFTYGTGKQAYYIVEVTKKHEETHRDDYLNILDKVKNEFKLPEKLIDYKPDCNEIDKYNDALKKGAEKIKDRLKEFLQIFKKKWYEKVGTKGSNKRKAYEQQTQNNVGYIIKNYIKRLEAIYPNKKCF